MAGPGDVRAGGAFVEITGDNSKLRKSLQDSEGDFKKYRDAAMRISTGVETPLEKLKKKLEEVKALGAKGWIDPDTTRRAIVQIKQQAAELRAAAQSVETPLKRLTAARAAAGPASPVATAENPGGLAGLKKSLGEGSAVGDMAKMLSFAGPIAAIGIIIQQINKMTGAWADLATQYRAGQISYQDYVNEMLKSVPSIGLVVGIFENVSEAITGAKFKLDQLRQGEKDARGKIDGAGFQSGEYDPKAAERRAFNMEADLNTKKLSPLERARVEAANPFTDRIFDINSERDAAIKGVREKNQKTLDDLKSVTDAPKGRVSDIQRAEAQSKIDEIEGKIAEEIGAIKKAAAKEIAANQKAKAAAILEAEKKNAEEVDALKKSAGDFVAKTIKGFGVFGGGGMFGGGGKGSPISDAKNAISQMATSVGGFGSDVSGLSGKSQITQIVQDILVNSGKIAAAVDGGIPATAGG